MSETLLWMHPLMQVFAALLGIWAMYQGFIRVRVYLGKKLIFPWKKHVLLGTLTLVLWLLGSLGFYVTHDIFGATHITGLHATLAWPIIGLSILGLITGYIMNKYKRKRFYLPILHGSLNVFLILLVAYECYSGIELWETFGM